MSATLQETTLAEQGRKLLYLMNDFVVQEHVCNLRCSYCLNFENENLKDGAPWIPPERIDLKTGSHGWQRARKMLALCRERGDAPILRVAGGEIMAIAGSLDFLEGEAPAWERLQVLTNATFVEQHIQRLAALPGLNLCCSVDGHTPELNRERTPHRRWAERIIGGLRAAIEAAIPVEVYMVLTKANVAAVHEFASWLYELPRRADVRLLPFPVRGTVAQEQLPAPGDYGALRQLCDDYERLREVLPPRAFLLRLLEFCESGLRTTRCRVPLVFQQTFDDGVVASCSNCWASPLGNLLERPTVFEEVGRANIHKLFLRNPPRFPFCRTCFTPFDVVNTFLDGDCTLEELGQMDLYSSAGVRTRLAAMREEWANGKAGALWA